MNLPTKKKKKTNNANEKSRIFFQSFVFFLQNRFYRYADISIFTIKSIKFQVEHLKLKLNLNLSLQNIKSILSTQKIYFQKLTCWFYCKLNLTVRLLLSKVDNLLPCFSKLSHFKSLNTDPVVYFNYRSF